jgi:hypothetical protein
MFDTKWFLCILLWSLVTFFSALDRAPYLSGPDGVVPASSKNVSGLLLYMHWQMLDHMILSAAECEIKNDLLESQKKNNLCPRYICLRVKESSTAKLTTFECVMVQASDM